MFTVMKTTIHIYSDTSENDRLLRCNDLKMFNYCKCIRSSRLEMAFFFFIPFSSNKNKLHDPV